MSDLDEIPSSDQLDGADHPRETVKLVGQSRAETDFLTGYNSGRLHHAWMITGNKGIGKATLAYKIATFLLAEPPFDPLFGQTPAPQTSLDISADHPVLRRIRAGSEPRLAVARIPYDEKAKRLKTAITVDEIRRLKNYFSLSSADGGRRVALIDAADDMNSAAANALLKLLEEPPDNTTLLLIAHQPSKLLPTIRSRCRVLKCDTLIPEDMAWALSGQNQSLDQINALNELAGGSVGRAIQILNTNGLEIYATLISLLSQKPQMDRQMASALAASCVGKDALDRYDMVIEAINILLSRLARFGALGGGDFTEIAQGEARVMAELANGPQTALKWAELSGDFVARVTHARAVNLDPSAVILDTVLSLDKTSKAL